MLRAELRGAFYRTRIDYECVVSKLSLHFGVRMLILSTCHVNERSYSAGWLHCTYAYMRYFCYSQVANLFERPSNE